MPDCEDGMLHQNLAKCFVPYPTDVAGCQEEILISYGCALNLLPSFLQMRRMIAFPELALLARAPIIVAHTPTK
jgi:hypothetical protein